MTDYLTKMRTAIDAAAEGNRCAGSYKKPTEAMGEQKPMTAAERRLAKEMFG